MDCLTLHFINNYLVKESVSKMLKIVMDKYTSLLLFFKENIDDLDLDLTFSAEREIFGKLEETELIPGGKNIKVTEANKEEYIKLISEYYLNANTTEQFKEIMIAFYEMIPSPWLAFIDDKELELLMCGIQSYDLQDWRRHTIYKKGYDPNSLQIIWFWEAVKKMEPQDKARLIQFTTGTSRIPATGFSDLFGSITRQPFCIEKWGKPSHLPRSHTCFNRIDLPPYNSYEELEAKLLIAIHESSGFHEE
ncbi:hypothetical protein HZS_2164 [Henneguya salminicola]|nr:hypothetical protein HZS_2164 [Henneguya salminicola]